MSAHRPNGPVLLAARWVVGFDGRGHRLLENGEVVFEGERIVFVGHGFSGEVARRIDYGQALIGPGFIDLDALSDLDTTILGFDNQPAWRKGRIWPQSYMASGPFEHYSAEELRFQKSYAFAQLLKNGITTVLPIASLFYREWGETWDEFAHAADSAAEMGLRVYLGPAYRSGNLVVDEAGRIEPWLDEERGLASLGEAVRFAEAFDGRHGGLVRAMLAPDRIETCTPALLRRTAAASRDLGIPVRLHCCQSRLEYDLVLRQHGMSPPEWLESLGFLSERCLLPHGTYVSGSRYVDRPGRDLEIIRDAGASIVHCPLVAGRHGSVIESFRRYREMGLKLGLGTDTYPPDMVLNMQVGMILARTVERDAGAVRSEHYYDAATLGGAEALGRSDLGRLTAGAMADITVLDLSGFRMGQVIDPIQTMMLNASGRDFRTVIVGGRFAVDEYRLSGIDERAWAARAQAQFEKVMSQYPLRTLGHPPVQDIFSTSYPVVRAA
jgi:cytosine/adenosine deaminase-related metal-dependent hydrolase